MKRKSGLKTEALGVFYKTYYYNKTRKWQLLLWVLLLVVGLLFIASKLKFEEDISKLIPQSEETKTLNKVLNNVNFSDKIVINITALDKKNPNVLTSYATALIDSINLHCKDFIIEIQGEISNDDMLETMDFIYDNLPYFLEEEDYKHIGSKLSKDSIDAAVISNYKTLLSPSGWIAKKTIRKDPFGIGFMALKKLESLKINDSFDIFNGFLVTKDRSNLLLFIKPKLSSNETDANADFVKKLNTIAKELNNKYVGIVSSEYYGATIVAVANANQIKKDITYTVSIAMSILFLILILFYKRISIPLILFIPTLIGALIAVASLYLIRERISAISLGIGAVLLGITLDYSLHILTHYRKNNNVKQLYKDVSQPIIMSSITTAIAFLCLLLLKSQALQDLGIFAAISVFSASIFALLLIPILYTPKGIQEEKRTGFIESLAKVNYDRSKVLLLSIVLLLIGSLFYFQKVKFNKDLSRMNYQTEALIEAEHRLDTLLNLSSKSVYIVAYGQDIDSVLETNAKINKLLEKEKSKDKLIQYSSQGALVISKAEQVKKRDKWKSFWKDSLKTSVKSSLITSGEKIGFKPNTYSNFYALLDKEYELIELEEYANIKSLLTKDFISYKSDFKTAVSIVKIKEDQKENLVQQVSTIPKAMLIDRKEISETFLSGLKDNFSSLINYSFLAVFLVLLLFFRNIELSLFTAFPIVLTWVLTLGIMSFFGIEFTIFNVIISTFIFGLGIDYSIFITNALVKDFTYGTKEINTYKVSIILSVITTILGVGVLIFAKHPALKSIASVSLIGILISVWVTFTIQAFLFRLFFSNRTKKGFAPLQLRTTFHSFLLLALYGIGGILLSMISLVLELLPIRKKVKYKWLHKQIAWSVTAVLYANPFVKKKVNYNGEDLSKPAIIIANHSSSLDSLTFGMMTSNIIHLVNKWVSKSPIFGILTRVAGFYPISNGVDESISYLTEKVEQGYSLMLFPEAKRSLTNKVGRFHKGAFFLQEKLGLDILLVYLIGNAEVMPKNDFVIHDGSLTVIVGERIPYDNKEFGETIKQRTKRISTYFKENLLVHRKCIEKEDYFRKLLYSNYDYKIKSVQQLVREDFNINKSLYLRLNNELPVKTKVLHIADDFGQIDILLVSRSLDRKITTCISDKNKRMIAENCYTSRNRHVGYQENLSQINSAENTILLLSDSKSKTSINSLDFNTFESIYIINQVYPIDTLIAQGYKLRIDETNFTVLDR